MNLFNIFNTQDNYHLRRNQTINTLKDYLMTSLEKETIKEIIFTIELPKQTFKNTS